MENLLKLAASLGDDPIKRRAPPVDQWNPPYCGDMDLVIQRDGLWVHEKTPIGRPQLVQLFASILKKEGENYYLVTPVEKIGIKVEDVPFLINSIEETQQEEMPQLVVETNLGEKVPIDKTHPLEFRAYRPEGTGEETPAPYVRVRRNLDARFSRNAWYALVALAKTNEETQELGIWSSGIFFPLPSVNG